MNKQLRYALCLAIAGTLGSAALTSCSSDVDATPAEQSPASEEITVAPFPSYAAETRAVSGAPTDEKSEWTEGDVIFVQVNDGDWKSMEYTSDGWDATDISISKGDSYKAVYAPNYEISDGELVLVIDEDGNTAIGSTGEYLETEGTGKPVLIKFVRDYARLRVFVGKSRGDITLSFGDGYATNDNTTVSSFTLTPDANKNVYVYGSWKDGTSLEISALADGNPQSDAIYSLKQVIEVIDGDSEAGKSYAADLSKGEKCLVHNLDNATASIKDWTGYNAAGYNRLKVVGTWNEDTAPVFNNEYNNKVNSFAYIDLSEVTGLTTIGSEAFHGNTDLIQIKLPESVTIIGSYAFYGCSSLIMPKLPEKVQTLSGGAFIGCSSLSLEEIPESLQKINTDCFVNSKVCFSTIPKNVTNIETSLFGGCTFDNEYGAGFEWPGHLTTIPAGTFATSNLESIIIPEEVMRINANAFYNCDKLTKVICKRTTPPTLGNDVVFANTPSDKILYVLEEAIANYVMDTSWPAFFDENHIKSIESLSNVE
jgi:hypothetical protein